MSVKVPIALVAAVPIAVAALLVPDAWVRSSAAVATAAVAAPGPGPGPTAAVARSTAGTGRFSALVDCVPIHSARADGKLVLVPSSGILAETYTADVAVGGLQWSHAVCNRCHCMAFH